MCTIQKSVSAQKEGASPCFVKVRCLSSLVAVSHVPDPVWEAERSAVVRCALHILDDLSVVCHRAFPLQNLVSGQYVCFKQIFQYGVVHFSLTTLSMCDSLLFCTFPSRFIPSFDLHVRLSLSSERVQLRPWLFWENSAAVVPKTCFKTAYLTHRANRTQGCRCFNKPK